MIQGYADELAARGHEISVVRLRERAGLRVPGWSRRGRVPSSVRVVTTARLTPDVVPDGDVVLATDASTSKLLPALSDRHGRAGQLVQSREQWEADPGLRLAVPKIATSERLAGVLNGLGVPSSAVTVVSQGLNLAVFRPPHPALPRGHRVSVLVGPDSGAATALEALERTRALLPTMEVTAFGAGRRPERLPLWIRYLRALPTYELVRQVYQRDAVHLGDAVSSAQAMACGSAVVGVRGSAVEDFAEHDRNSLLVEAGDVNTMAESLVRLMLDRDLRTRLTAGGLRTTEAMDSSDSALALEKALHSWTSVVAPQR
ncbi:hypothetical protein ACFFG9_48210 [Kutzneria buriramensis]